MSKKLFDTILLCFEYNLIIIDQTKLFSGHFFNVFICLHVLLLFFDAFSSFSKSLFFASNSVFCSWRDLQVARREMLWIPSVAQNKRTTVMTRYNPVRFVFFFLFFFHFSILERIRPHFNNFSYFSFLNPFICSTTVLFF